MVVDEIISITMELDILTEERSFVNLKASRKLVFEE